MPLSDGYDVIVNQYSGKALDDPNYSTANGTQMIQYQLTANSNQEWQVLTLRDGYVELINKASGKALTDPNNSLANGAPMVQYPYAGGTNQQWILLAAGAGSAVRYTVSNAYSHKVLDDPNFSTASYTHIIQYQDTGGTNQQWDFVPLADGNEVIVNVFSGNVLENPNFSTSNGTQVIQDELNGAANQQWNVLPARKRQLHPVQCRGREGARGPELLHRQRYRPGPVAVRLGAQPAVESSAGLTARGQAPRARRQAWSLSFDGCVRSTRTHRPTAHPGSQVRVGILWGFR